MFDTSIIRMSQVFDDSNEKNSVIVRCKCTQSLSNRIAYAITAFMKMYHKPSNLVAVLDLKTELTIYRILHESQKLWHGII